MKKVLVLENREIDFCKIKSAFAGKVEILHAVNQWEFEKFLKENPDIDLAMMDYFSPGEVPNTLSLLRKTRRNNPNMPIISISLMHCFREEMIKAGANYGGEKEKAVGVALKFLGL